MTARYAVYFAPDPTSDLHRFGARWLGRDPASGVRVPQPEVPGVPPDELARITASARRYGFHATLKAPMRLADGADPGALDDAVRALAAGMRPFAVRLALRSLHGFLALMLAEPSPAMQRLADACVERLDPLRAPPSDAERARRLSAGLSPEQARHLDRWGYPFVFEQFRFHMTLSDRLDDRTAALVRAALGPEAAAACAAPVAVDALTVFEEPAPGADLLIRSRHPLGG